MEDKLISSEKIQETIKALNAAENQLSSNGVEKTMVSIDKLMTHDVEGWANGEHRPDRETERKFDRILLTDIPDYRREIGRIIIDPPYAAFSWQITGTSKSTRKRLNVLGSSQAEFSADGKIRKYWVYVDTAQMPF